MDPITGETTVSADVPDRPAVLKKGAEPARRNGDADELKAALKHLRAEPVGWVFSLKLLLCAALTAGGVAAALQPEVWWRVLGVAVIGCMFAHAAELQHETLHNLAYRSRRANTVAGTVLGLPMLISFAAYRVTHLRHHRDLGTPMNREFFDYGDQYGGAAKRSAAANTLIWCVRFSMVHHYGQFLVNLGRSVLWRDMPGESPSTSRRIRIDHLLTAGVVLALAGMSLAAASPVLVWVWLLPLVVVAGPVHAFIELPEHYRCETLSRDPMANTRTIRSNPVMTWFTNGNNFHVEHHLMPNLPIQRLPAAHTEVRGQLIHFNTGYVDYFSELVRR